VLPPAVAGIALLAAVGRGGLFGDSLANAGIVLPFSEWAVVLAVTFVASPFYVRQAINAFEAVDTGLVDAAHTLGASPARTFARVSLPLAAGGLATGWVLAFARGVGEFGATIVFAGNVRGRTQTLTLAIYDQLEANFDVAIALGIMLVVLSAGVLTSNTVSQEPDVASITSKVALGSADAGFVYHTDALASRGRTNEIRLPKYAQPAVRYQACAVRRRGADTRGAQSFIRLLRGSRGRSALHHFGFGLPPRG